MPGKLGSLALLAGVAITTAALVAFWRSPPERVPASIAVPVAESRVDSSDHLFRPRAGMRYIYGFQRSINFDGDLGGAKMPPVGFKGEFYVDVLSADKAGFEAVVSERVEGIAPPREPFVRVTASARGDSLSFFKAEDLSEEERQHVAIVKDLVSLWLFPLRTDTVGDFEAQFEPQPAEAGFARERKIKLMYRSHAPNTPEILHSEHNLIWDLALHLPKEVNGAEATKLGRGQSALTADSRYRLVFRKLEKAPLYGEKFLAGLGGKDTLALNTSQKASMADHPDYKNLNWGKILSDIKTIDRLSGMQQLGVFGDAVRFLRLHPDQAADLVAMIQDPAMLQAGAGSAQFRTAIGALATAGGPANLAALCAAYQDPSLDAEGKQMILASITTTSAPIDAATRDFLAQTMQSEPNSTLAQSAAFALGSALQSGPNDAKAAGLINAINSQFASASSPDQQQSLLDIMGNSGRAEFLPSIEAALAPTEPPLVQAKAEYALRFINTPVATQALLQGMSSPDATMRGAAASAINAATWNEAFRASLTTCSNADPVSQIKSTCSTTLAAHAQVASSD